MKKSLKGKKSSGWKPIDTAPPYITGCPILCRNKNHWPEICYVKDGMAFDRRGYAMVGYVPIEWFKPAGILNWFNKKQPEEKDNPNEQAD